MASDNVQAVIMVASALGQVGIAAAALKVAMELKAAVLALKEQFGDHENRISKLEGD